MFVTNVADIVLIEHRFQRHQLGDEDAIGREHLRGIANELIRILHIVEHADGGDDFGFFDSELIVIFFGPEITDDMLGICPQLG